mmetsp:Transcript_25848/g.85059  ORF Transcript_25848/g.85059 Transcript_25848/m.85059 type:complete len:310 (+) Transcript_25848:1144-2073(+)
MARMSSRRLSREKRSWMSPPLSSLGAARVHASSSVGLFTKRCSFASSVSAVCARSSVSASTALVVWSSPVVTPSFIWSVVTLAFESLSFSSACTSLPERLSRSSQSSRMMAAMRCMRAATTASRSWRILSSSCFLSSPCIFISCSMSPSFSTIVMSNCDSASSCSCNCRACSSDSRVMRFNTSAISWLSLFISSCASASCFRKELTSCSSSLLRVFCASSIGWSSATRSFALASSSSSISHRPRSASASARAASRSSSARLSFFAASFSCIDPQSEALSMHLEASRQMASILCMIGSSATSSICRSASS